MAKPLTTKITEKFEREKAVRDKMASTLKDEKSFNILEVYVKVIEKKMTEIALGPRAFDFMLKMIELTNLFFGTILVDDSNVNKSKEDLQNIFDIVLKFLTLKMASKTENDEEDLIQITIVERLYSVVETLQSKDKEAIEKTLSALTTVYNNNNAVSKLAASEKSTLKETIKFLLETVRNVTDLGLSFSHEIQSKTQTQIKQVEDNLALLETHKADTAELQKLFDGFTTASTSTGKETMKKNLKALEQAISIKYEAILKSQSQLLNTMTSTISKPHTTQSSQSGLLLPRFEAYSSKSFEKMEPALITTTDYCRDWYNYSGVVTKVQISTDGGGVLNLYASLFYRAAIVVQERVRKCAMQTALSEHLTFRGNDYPQKTKYMQEVLTTKKSYDRLQLLDQHFSCVFSGGTWTKFLLNNEPTFVQETWDRWMELYLFQFFRGECANSTRPLRKRNRVVCQLQREQHGVAYTVAENRVQFSGNRDQQSQIRFNVIRDLLLQLSKAMQNISSQSSEIVDISLFAMRMFLAEELEQEHIVWSSTLYGSSVLPLTRVFFISLLLSGSNLTWLTQECVCKLLDPAGCIIHEREITSILEKAAHTISSNDLKYGLATLMYTEKLEFDTNSVFQGDD